MAEQYNIVLKELLDKHAPERSILVTIRPKAPWYTNKVREAKRSKRRAERKLKSSVLEVDRQLFKGECKSYNAVLSQSKYRYLTDEIAQCDTKHLFQLVQTLSRPKSQHLLPDHESDINLANYFGQFFYNKIQDIVTNLQGITSRSSDCEDGVTTHKLSSFEPVSELEVQKVIRESSSKSCRLDPIPTWLMKDCIYGLVPFVTELVNLSLSSGEVPAAYKTSHVTPLLKKNIFGSK